MRPLIYDAKFKMKYETTQAMEWIYYPDLKPAFLVKESLFSLATAVGQLIQLDLATWPNRARVKVQVDLLEELPKCVKIKMINDTTRSQW